MRKFSKAVAFALVIATGSGAAQAGCLGGAVVGGVAGHVAGHHALAGAAVGCVVGHEMSVRKKRRLAAERAATRDARDHHMQPAPAH